MLSGKLAARPRVAGVPAALWELAEAALAFDPGARLRSAGELATRLDGLGLGGSAAELGLRAKALFGEAVQAHAQRMEAATAITTPAAVDEAVAAVAVARKTRKVSE